MTKMKISISEKAIGKNIKSMRKKLNLSQEELAINAGVKYSNLVKIENSIIVRPSVYTIYRVAKALNTSVEKLIE
jgi:transcriptional regulator with XRE-family HTH domain